MFKFCLCLFEGKLDEVYEALNHAHPNMTVYKKEQIPERLHYKHNSKIQPILAVADKGWEIVQNKSDGFQRKYSLPLPRSAISNQRTYMVLSLPISTNVNFYKFYLWEAKLWNEMCRIRNVFSWWDGKRPTVRRGGTGLALFKNETYWDKIIHMF